MDAARTAPWGAPRTRRTNVNRQEVEKRRAPACLECPLLARGGGRPVGRSGRHFSQLTTGQRPLPKKALGGARRHLFALRALSYAHLPAFLSALALFLRVDLVFGGGLSRACLCGSEPSVCVRTVYSRTERSAARAGTAVVVVGPASRRTLRCQTQPRPQKPASLRAAKNV